MDSQTAEMHDEERRKWDELAGKKLATLEPTPMGENFHTYARGSAVMPGVSEFLGDLTGKRILEYGCGMGEMSVRLARSGAQVSTFDISAGSVDVTKARAELDGLSEQIDARVATAEDLPYEDASFDLVIGKAILHHIDPALGAPPLARVMAPGGRAAFVEPMGMNPVLSFARDHVPYPGKNPPGGDKPVNYEEIAAWGAGFSTVELDEIQLLSMVERGLGFGTRIPSLRRADKQLLARFPGLKRYCRYVVMCMTK